jgi:hypothetical protein
MNDRIKELKQKALCVKSGELTVNGGEVELVDLEKFAQLIVLECEKLAKNPKWYGESPSNGWRNPIRHVCSLMKDHFGIKND